MKRLLLIVVSAFGVLLAQAQQVLDLRTGALTDGVTSTVPTRDVETLPGGYRVTYTFKNALLQADDLFGGTTFWKVDGFGLNSLSGAPSTLVRGDMLAIPEGYVATVEVTDSTYRDFPFELTPARQPLIDSGDEVYTRENVQAIAPYEGYKPLAIVSQQPTQSYRGHDLCLVDVSPIQYNYAEKTVRAYTSITYKVTFVPKVKESSAGATEKPKYLSPDDRFFANNVIGGELLGEANAKAFAQDGAAQADVKDYLIISKKKYSEAVNRFAEWKRLMGFNVHVAYDNDWVGSLVKKTITEAYNEFPALYYVLIIGDYADVNPKRSVLRNVHDSDYPYECIENDIFPDIYCGRLSVSTAEEAINVVEKIIGYEKTPPDKKSFYDTGLHCAYFESTKDGHEYKRFTRTSEDVLSYVKSQGKNLLRVYSTSPDATPLFWNDGKYADGSPVPDELRKPTFAWDGNADNIAEAINKGVFYVLHLDHGKMEGWIEPHFTLKDISKLANGNLLPVVFSINCLSGKFDGNCFAESLLRKPDGGCVAIYAATEISLAGYNDALTTGMFDAIWPNPGISIRIPKKDSVFSTTPSPVYTLGQILHQGKLRVSETYGYTNESARYTNELFDCFGDPSMKIYTDVPTPFTNVSIRRRKHDIVIKLKRGEEARISAYNTKSGKIDSYIGNSVVIDTSDPDGTAICVSAHNRIPFVQIPDVMYVQNKNITGEFDEKHDVIKVGNHVTETESHGDVTTTNAEITLKAKKVVLDKGTYISKGTKLKVNP